MAILITGGSGYIGSHTCVELLKSGYDIIIIDNFSNSKPEVVHRIEILSGCKVLVYEADLIDINILRKIFYENIIDSVIHFAGYKSVAESVSNPHNYYHNNITATLVLIQVMNEFNIKKIIFSSSATVYGIPVSIPITESNPLNPVNPYGRIKKIIENFFYDLYSSDNNWSIVILRYFNPIGAHKSGLIGEDPNGIPNNLVPLITQVLIGKRKELLVFGNDYRTHDGTCIRDYIHVHDVALGHIKALELKLSNQGFNIYNLGTGKGYSVFDIINTFEKVTGKKIPYIITKRRDGDIECTYADSTLAFKELCWKAEKDLNVMCADAWHWQLKNPSGYNS